MLTLVWSPVHFFRVRLQRRPALIWAVAAPLTCAALELTAALIFAAKNEAMLESLASAMDVAVGSFTVARLSAVSTVFGYPILYGTATFAMICFDILGKDSGNPRRIAELTALAFMSCVPACLFMCLAAAIYQPPVIDVPDRPSIAQIQHAVDTYRQALDDDPWLATSRILYYASVAWLMTLLASILRAAAGYSSKGAAMAGLVLFAALGGFYLVTS